MVLASLGANRHCCTLNASVNYLKQKYEQDEREACAALCSEVAAGRDAEDIEEAILARGKK